MRSKRLEKLPKLMNTEETKEKDVIIYDKENTDSKEAKPVEAYDPETGEINWDCPCLGPMVLPPCGDKFKEAFSCFVHSTAEPKGSECVDQFREMQKCFQENPEIYGAELGDDDAASTATETKEASAPAVETSA